MKTNKISRCIEDIGITVAWVALCAFVVAGSLAGGKYLIAMAFAGGCP